MTKALLPGKQAQSNTETKAQTVPQNAHMPDLTASRNSMRSYAARVRCT